MSIILRTDLKDDTFLKVAAQLSALGTCDRAAVGAVIVRDGRCISWGYNGAPPGTPHCSENDHGWRGQGLIVGDETEEEKLEADRAAAQALGCVNATHAEANAVAFAARQGISTDGTTLYVTVSPCEVCARLLIAAGIVRAVWETEYRDPRGLNLLAEAGVELL